MKIKNPLDDAVHTVVVNAFLTAMIAREESPPADLRASVKDLELAIDNYEKVRVAK